MPDEGIRFLDTNVLLRHFLQDDPDQSPRATACLQRIEDGALRVRIADTVVFETVFVLERRYRQPKEAIGAVLRLFVALPSVALSAKARMLRALGLYADLNLPFADAYHAAVALDTGIAEILSFDRDFDRIAGITRFEP